MEHKNFFANYKYLHEQVVEEIKSLMREHNTTEVDLLGSNCDHAQITGMPVDFMNTDEPMSMEVSKVYLDGDKLLLDVILDIDTDELADISPNGDIGDAYRVYNAEDYMYISCDGSIESVYEAIYQVLVYGK